MGVSTVADYTPDTYLVRRVYSLAPPNLAGCDHVNTTPDYAGAQFDRWLAQERAEAGAQALEQAADDLYSDDGPGNPLSTTTWLRERAARLRGGGDQ